MSSQIDNHELFDVDDIDRDTVALDFTFTIKRYGRHIQGTCP